MKNKTNNESERKLVESVHQAAAEAVLTDYVSFCSLSENSLHELNSISPIFNLLKKKFFQGLVDANNLSRRNFELPRFDLKRIAKFSQFAQNDLKNLDKLFPPAGKIWVLGGLLFDKQVAGIKNLSGFDDGSGQIIDVLNSAASLSLGAENPWLAKMDYIEDVFGIRDNFCAAYHPSQKQAFSLRKLAELYPNKSTRDLVVHSESSGTIVNSIAIESVVAFAEKKFGNQTERKVLAVDGTWAGGYGTSREGSGFGVNNQQYKKIGKNLWVDRCLPAPTTENSQSFLKILHEKLSNGFVAGIYLEPDVVGDLGLLTTDPELLFSVKKMMRDYVLPIILDCVQQLGRSGSYWGENVDAVFADYELLVMTAAKSASNGQAFAFTIMPKAIADAAYPLSQITTNQMNNSSLRSLVVADVLQNDELQNWLANKSKDIEEIAVKYDFEAGPLGLRGKYLNRGVYLENNDLVKLAQIALLLEDGILVGATPNSIRYQPMLLEYSETNKFTAEIIFRRLKMVKEGKVSQTVLEVFQNMNGIETGLARSN